MSMINDLIDSYEAGMKALEEHRYYEAAKMFVIVENIQENSEIPYEVETASRYVKTFEKDWWWLYQMLTKDQRREIKRIEVSHPIGC